MRISTLHAGLRCDSRMSKKRSYDAAFKLKVVEYGEQNTNRGAAKKNGVDEKRVRDWKEQKLQGR